MDRLHLVGHKDRGENSTPRAAIVEKYDLTASALDRWIKQSKAT